MPAHRKTKEDRVRERFSEMYKIGKARSGLNEADISCIVGVTPFTMRRKRNDPEELTLSQFAVLAETFRWRDEDVLKLISAMRSRDGTV